MNSATKEDRDNCAHAARNCGMPLGGIGAGSIEISPDGYFYRWYCMNNKAWGAGPATSIMEREGLRFGLLVDGAGSKRCFALGQNYGLDPVADGWFWNTDPYHIPWIEHASAIEYNARIPIADLKYLFRESPIAVKLTAWSPLIPHHTAESNTPGAIFDFTLQNVSSSDLDISLWGLLKNGAGYDCPDLPSSTIFSSRANGIVCSRQDLPKGHCSDGSMCLSVKPAVNGETSYALHAPHGRYIWDPLMEQGRLENLDFGMKTAIIGEVGAETTISGPTGNQRSAICFKSTIPAGGFITVSFILTWYFPNMRELSGGNTSPEIIGHQYTNRFGSSEDVALWLLREKDSLFRETQSFVMAFYESSLPHWYLNAINAQLSPLLRSAWYDRQGRFGIWEGLGRCGLQTVDVSHYASHYLAVLFPDLDRSQQELVLNNVNRAGKVPHTMHGVFNDGEKNCDKRIDLCAQFALAVWRYALWNGDLDLVNACRPAIEKNLEIIASTDSNKDGLPDAVGRDQTYDKFDVTGSSILINMGYIAALYGYSQLCLLLGDKTRAASLLLDADSAVKKVKEQLWNGAYFNLAMDPVTGRSNSGCLTDQVNGLWFYHQTCGESFLDSDTTNSLFDSILRHNSRSAGPNRWLVNCSWPQGDVIPFERNGSHQANSPWSGVEYAFAAHLVLMGRREEAQKITKAVFDRYDDYGMRFNHYECGEYYHRAMSAFALYHAEFGLFYNAFEKTLRVNPPQAAVSFVLVLPTGWARAQVDVPKRLLRLRDIHGDLLVKRVDGPGGEYEIVREGQDRGGNGT